MQRNRSLHGIIYIFLILICSGVFKPVSAQSEVSKLIINEVDTTEFPQVSVQLRAVDRDGLPISTLPLSAFQISENDIPLAPTKIENTEVGIQVHFVIDAGASLNRGRWAQIQTALTEFIQNSNWMNESLDQVAITAVEPGGRKNISDFSSDKELLLRSVTNYVPDYQTAENPSFSNPLGTIDNILDEMALIPDSEVKGKAQFVVLFTAGLETNATLAPGIISQANELGIPIYVSLVRTSESSVAQVQSLKDLADGTGGVYTLYRNVSDNLMNPAFSQLISYRTQFHLWYRTTVNTSGTRQISIAANESTVTTTYNIDVAPPRAVILEPETNDLIERKAPSFTADLNTVEPTNKTVVIEVSFPDGYERAIKSTELLVDGEVVRTITSHGSGTVQLSWDLRSIKTVGTTALTLWVELEDELGLVSRSSSVNVKVNLFIPPEPTLTIPEIITQVVATLPPTPTPIPCILPDPMCTLERDVRVNARWYLTLVLMTLVVGFVWLNRGKVPQAVTGVRNTIVNIGDQISRTTQRWFGITHPKAYVIVLEGDTSSIGKKLEIYGDTAIGRSRQDGAEMLFHQSEELQSPISRLHCTIIDEEDHFMLRDDDSANGTYLNGARLTPLVPEELDDGDEIELGRIERGGVKLLFQLADEGNSNNDRVTRETRQTRDTDRVQPSEGDRF